MAKRNDPRDPSPPVTARIHKKNAIYATLMTLLQSQLRRQVRSTPVKFISAVVTHFGELSPQVFDLINILAQEKFHQHKKHPPTDLSTPKSERAHHRSTRETQRV